MKILIIFPEKKTLELLTFTLESKFSATIFESDSITKSIKLLEEIKDLDLIICDAFKETSELLRHVLKNSKKTHCIFSIDKLPESKPQRDTIHFILKDKLIDELSSKVQNLFPNQKSAEPQVAPLPTTPAPTVSASAEQEAEASLDDEKDFCRIKTNLLLTSSPLKSDIYIRLSSKKFVKIFHGGDVFDKEDFEKYTVKKGLNYLFLKHKDTVDFLNEFTSLLKAAFYTPEEDSENTETNESTAEKATPPPTAAPTAKTEPVKQTQKSEAKKEAPIQSKLLDKIIERENAPIPIPPEKKSALMKALTQDPSSTREMIGEVAGQLGFTKEVQELTKASVKAAVAGIKKNPRLSQILDHVNKDPEKYLSTHSTLLAHLSCALATQMEWKSDSTYEKLTLASFLHDVIIKNQVLARIDTLEELEKRKHEFTEQEIREFKTHPLVGAQLACQFQDVPPDVDTIISQHHERPDGTGFPRNLSHSRISPISCIFIIAHDLVKFLLEDNEDAQISKATLEKFFELNKTKYQGSNFKKLLKIVPSLST